MTQFCDLDPQTGGRHDARAGLLSTQSDVGILLRWTEAGFHLDSSGSRKNNLNELKVLTVFGTRPEAVKLAPVIRELEKHPEIDSRGVCDRPTSRDARPGVGSVPDPSAL